MRNPVILLLLIITNSDLISFAQNKNEIGQAIAAMDSVRNKLPIEKVFLHLDKPYYASTDTIWLKAYLFDAAYLKAAKSGLLYIELVNDSNKVVKRVMVPVIRGISYGDIALEGDNISDGVYALRAYTNWMRNFGEDYIFKKTIFIINTEAEPWLVKSRVRQLDKNDIKLSLQFNKMDQQAIGLREMQLKLIAGKKTLFQDNTETRVDGTLDINFTLPQKADIENIALVAEDLRNGEGNRKLIIPFILNRPENIDLQFMPEGGNLVNGILSRIGFKALGEDGKGTDISGKIYNSLSQEVASFKSAHKGMGSFDLLPAANEGYSARVILPDGSTKVYPLPLVNNSGTAMSVTNPKQSDSLQVSISSYGMENLGSRYYLVGQARGIVCYGAGINLQDNQYKINVPKSAFPSGITRFTLLNARRQPLNERLVYIDHEDNLQISITPDKTSYTKRDSIALQISITDKSGRPVQGNFSLAVTDDAQVKNSTTDANMISDLLLTSDLKGHVEEPGYYHQSGQDETWQDLDNLLLTQGWVGYEWQDVFKPAKAPLYKSEIGFIVNGKVVNMFNNPIPNSEVNLLSKKTGIVKAAFTNETGQFTFSNIFPVEKEAFFIQARNKGKSFNVGIEVEDFKPPVFTAFTHRLIPWYIDSDTMQLKYVQTALLSRAEQDKLTAGSRVLKEVTITATKIIKASKNLNGLGEADLVLDEKDMEKAGKMTLGELLREKMQAGRRLYKMIEVPFYMIGPARVHLFIDGLDAENYGIYDLTKPFLDYYTAEDIIGIEIMSSIKYRVSYDPNATVADIGCRGCKPPPMFIEITTRTGEGPFMKKTPGTYLYRPLAFSLPKQFYRPRYAVNDSGRTIDLRSTVHWQPEITTGIDGRATVSFFATDRVGSYTMILEGSDMHGNIGFSRKQINISDKR